MTENRKISLKQIIAHRLDKLNEIKSSGIDPFPHSFNVKENIQDIFSKLNKYINKNVSIAGRIVSLRKMGKVTFLNMQDQNIKIQIYLKANNLKDELYDNLVRKLDIGDIIGVNGLVFYTKTKELSVNAKKITLLSKSIRPLPNIKEKDGKTFFSFEDKELKYRNRHLDLIINKETTDVFILRSKIINEIRMFLNKNDYIEVETPILQPQYGGANAKPFKTYHNTLDSELYLRIADELYLKRLIIGGINKVYELSKNFRNEGMDKNHNPEFTMLEYYCAYADLYDMMKFTESLIKSIVKNSKCSLVNLNLNKKFKKIDYFESLNNFTKRNIKKMTSKDLSKLLKSKKIDFDDNLNYGKLLDKVFSFFVEPNLIEPTFVENYPVEISPLAKKNRKGKNNTVERFELFINGMELANAFTELNDPIDQKNRLNDQNNLRKAGDDEAHVIDNDFIEAMEYGMPPCGGVGIGIDRLVMIMTNNKSIKDVILFPSMRERDK